LRIRITELDIPMGSWGSQRQAGLPATDDELEKQALLYKDLFEIFVKYSDHIDAVTIWGLADPFSWRARGLPLLFDEYFEPKPSFYAVLSVVTETDYMPNPDDSIPPTPSPSPDTTTPAPEAPPADIIAPGNETSDSIPWLFAIIVSALAVIAVSVMIIVIIKSIKKK